MDQADRALVNMGYIQTLSRNRVPRPRVRCSESDFEAWREAVELDEGLWGRFENYFKQLWETGMGNPVDGKCPQIPHPARYVPAAMAELEDPEELKRLIEYSAAIKEVEEEERSSPRLPGQPSLTLSFGRVELPTFKPRPWRFLSFFPNSSSQSTGMVGSEEAGHESTRKID